MEAKFNVEGPKTLKKAIVIAEIYEDMIKKKHQLNQQDGVYYTAVVHISGKFKYKQLRSTETAQVHDEQRRELCYANKLQDSTTKNGNHYVEHGWNVKQNKTTKKIEIE